jgi:hypothetical protein
MLAGQKMERMMQATLMNVEKMIVSAILSEPEESIGYNTVSASTDGLIGSTQHNFDAFIIDTVQPGFSDLTNLWVSREDVVHKLRAWMSDNLQSRTLWIPSPYEPGVAVPTCRAAVMAAIATAWQAEGPFISYFYN